MKLISTVFAALLLAVGTAHADPNDKDNHAEGVGGHTLNELQKQGKPTAAAVKKERDLQKNWDRDKDNHVEGVGGHARLPGTGGVGAGHRRGWRPSSAARLEIELRPVTYRPAKL